MADDVYVHHPVFTDEVHLVPADKVQEHLDSGWVRVKRADESQVAEKVPLAEQTTEEK